MQYALVNGKRTEAKKGERGACPLCLEETTSKCGHIYIHHWAHKARLDCDDWYEPETEWHRKWKEWWPEEYREVIIEKNGKKHIADIRTNKGIVIEFQHSSIPLEEALQRTMFYGKIVWVFDGKECFDDGRFVFYDKGPYESFRWKQGKKSLVPLIKKTEVYLDLGNGELFALRKMYTEKRCAGWGHTINICDFIEMHTVLKNNGNQRNCPECFSPLVRNVYHGAISRGAVWYCWKCNAHLTKEKKKVYIPR